MNIFTNRLKELTEQPAIKAPAHYFQDQALQIVEELNMDKKYLGSIMRAYKRKPDKAEAVRRVMRNRKFKNPATYFLKLVNL